MALFRRRNTGRNRNIITLPRSLPSLDPGTMLFGLIFIYIIIALISYLTQSHVTGYEVVAGTISGNYRYSALVLKEEEIENSNVSGNVSYYAREGSKANVGMMICSVGGTAAGSEDSSITTSLSDEDLTEAKNEMSIFAVNFDEDVFSRVYDFKADMQGVILQSSIDENAGEYVSGSFEAPVPGFVVYSTDGLEGVTESDLKRSMFDQSYYTKNNLRLRSTVSSGDPLYKLVTNDTWSLCFPVDDRLKADLEGREKISVRFLKDNNSFSAPLELVNGLDGLYGKITMKSSLVRYVTDRYLDIELILDRTKGLKIPVSSITEKYFVRIPEEYVTENENSNSEIYLIRETFAADGSSSTSNVVATVYSRNKKEGYYLINPGLFDDGDYIVMPGTSRKYQISEDVYETIQGVYNINKGYAVFREVTIIDENEEFCIVDPTDTYGLSAHDRIVLNASEVKDDEIIN